MDMHGALDYRVGRFGVHDVEQDVDNLVASGSKNSGTEDELGFTVDDDFDETLGFAFLHRAADPLHRILGNERRPSRLSDFRVRHTAASQWRIDKQRICLDAI